MRYKGNFMLRLNRRCMAIRFRKENRRWVYHKEMLVTNKQNQNRVVPLTLGQVMVPVARWQNYQKMCLNCKGTADGGGNTSALEYILLTGNETDGAEACFGKRLALPK